MSTSSSFTGLSQRFADVANFLLSPTVATSAALILAAPLGLLFYLRSRPRLHVIPPYRERVLILGASSGVGATLAQAYAARGCRDVVLVARRQEVLEQVKVSCRDAAKKCEEWRTSQQGPGWEKNQGKERYWTVQADCTKAEDLVKVRDLVLKELGGLDTLHICFGVSALKPLLGIASVDPLSPLASSSATASSPHPTSSALSHVHSVVSKATEANLTATALALATFIPVMQSSSISSDPCIALLSSMAALMPAPTRGLYGATKAAQLLLFEGVALECEAQAQGVRAGEAPPKGNKKKLALVRFVSICPGTIKSDFRASAVDVSAGELDRIKDDSWSKGSGEGQKSASGGKSDILTPLQVAERMMLAVDRGTTGRICTPFKYAVADLLQPAIGPFLRKMAHKKYSY
ncbi:NAD(P)-binding protein [Tilletiaria anomala UBC 951]|uniref:NAD(P)-binding protein n=1 Tax=Tilletiaria anomala (strain ATCC 24038 / CBS 436.72 / UBC 951) TaxID=1037660 RepID=A0A066W2C8_TILAU|nr:NAD(P)-binding protein [Tilletiaria anomala UBC 951]KDN45239.1 NAD(P)-binding protein [Tilletiaria anomala UBC 951]